MEATWSFSELHKNLGNGRKTDKEHKKIVKVLNDVPAGASELAEYVKLARFRHFQEKTPPNNHQKENFSYETEDQPLDDRIKAYGDQCSNLVLNQAIQSIQCRLHLNSLEAM